MPFNVNSQQVKNFRMTVEQQVKIFYLTTPSYDQILLHLEVQELDSLRYCEATAVATSLLSGLPAYIKTNQYKIQTT